MARHRPARPRPPGGPGTPRPRCRIPGRRAAARPGPPSSTLHSSTPIPDRSPRPGGSGTGGTSPGKPQISPTQLDLGSGTAGQLTLTAVGGPVTWSAQTSAPGLMLSITSGSMAAGGREIMTVTVNRSQEAAGTAGITFGPSGAVVAG